jgi:AraC family transcriptional regulator
LSIDDDEWPGRAWRGRVDVDQSLLSQSVSKSRLNVIRHARRSGGGGWSEPSPVSDGFIVTPCLRPTRLAEVQFDGRTAASRVDVPTGGLLIYSLKQSYSVHIPDPFDAVSFRIDQKALDEKAREMGLPRTPELSEPFLSTPDETLLNLSKALLPALRRPAEVNSLFAEHVFDAILAHLIQSAAKFHSKPSVDQSVEDRIRVAQDFLLDSLGSDVTAKEVASACGLSINRFNRSFRSVTGLPPHKWLLQRRINRARELLEHTGMEIADIALNCGFADQSHMTRVFGQHLGMPPGAWRRSRHK